MDTKHNDDILKTMGENHIKKEGAEQPPATPQPKKQCCYDCKHYEVIKDTPVCHHKKQILTIWQIEPWTSILNCPDHKNRSSSVRRAK